MTLRREPFDFRGDLLDGGFVRSRAPDGELVCYSPADLDDLIGRCAFEVAHARRAVGAAKEAQRAWRRLDASARAGYLVRYRDALRARREEIAIAIARSIGKPLWEARTEADALVAKVDITLSAGSELIAVREIPSVQGRIRYRPIGVCAVIGPFNFPAHLPNGHIVPALATGNTVVFKPSERAPQVGALMAECFVEAGFPPGVVQVVQGDGSVARALVDDERVDAVMFTGSTAVGRSILASSARFPGRMLALELGGKNAALVLDDADVAYSAKEIAFAAFVTAGQRCTATSRVLVQRKVADELLSRLTFAAKHTRVGAPDHDDVFLGPMIDEQSLQRAIDVAASASPRCEAIVPLTRATVDGVRGHYASPALYRVVEGAQKNRSVLETEELFAPLVTLEVVNDDAAAIEAANDTPYGLAVSVFTSSRDRYESAALELDAGVCNWNRGTVGSASKLPFGGVKNSGNHRAAGLFSTLYCVDPVGEILFAHPDPHAPLPPGLRLP